LAVDAYYFSHDSNAKDDPKCVLLIEQLGLEGYGIYWVLVEMLRDQPGYKYPLSLIPAISRRYNTTFEKMKTVINNYGLFVVDEHDFFSLSLLKRMEHLDSKRIQASKAGKASAQAWRRINGRSTDVQQGLGDGSTIKPNLTTSKQNNSSCQRNEFADDAIEFIISTELLSYIRGNNPKCKEPNLQNWAKIIDLMIRRDNRSIVDIREVIAWCQKDSFWMSNILSAKKLREKFDQLILKMGKNTKPKIISTEDQSREILAKIRDKSKQGRE